MDLPDHLAVLRQVHRVLRPDGFLQFSILHPCFSPPTRRNIRNAEGTTIAVQVADYFQTSDGRIEEWRFGNAPAAEKAVTAPFRVPRFHRTLSSWFNLLIGTGFLIEEIGEPMADETTASEFPAVQDTRVVPLFLHLRVRKQASERQRVETKAGNDSKLDKIWGQRHWHKPISISLYNFTGMFPGI